MKSSRNHIYLFTLVLVLFIQATTASAQTSEGQRILFVGNSFTYFYNLPQVVAAMAETQGIPLITRQSTVGGSNLEQHWKGEKGTKTRALLESEQWDYVVFNNHSLSAIDSPESFMEYGQKFADLVKSKGAKPVFMITWAYDSNPLMQSEITESYKQLASKTASAFVPAGPLFAQARKWRPELELFFDDKHPSYIGTYLLGLSFYKYFTGNSVSTIPKRLTTTDQQGEKLYLMFMLEKDAAFLRQLVQEFDFETVKN